MRRKPANLHYRTQARPVGPAVWVVAARRPGVCYVSQDAELAELLTR